MRPAMRNRRAAVPGSFVGSLLVLVLAVLYLLRLVPQAAHARLYMDEPFHAYVAEWIAHHGALPRELPEFYSGLPYFYPPLLHLIAAGWVAVLGTAALPYLNLVVTAALFAVLWALPVPGLPHAPRRWAVLLCLANMSLTASALQLYAEALATVLAVTAVLLLLRWRATEAPRDAALTGAVIGLALTAKQTAPVLAALLGALAVLYLVRGERRLATGMLLALGIALLLWLPVLTRNALFFGSPLYPHLSGVQRTLLDLSTRSFQLTPARFYVGAFGTVGPMVLAATLAALIWSARQRRWGLPSAMLGLGGLAILAAPWVPRLEHRHLNPVCAVLALLASLLLHEGVRDVRWLRRGIEIFLLTASVLFVVRLPDVRARVDLPPWLSEACEAIHRQAPERGRVLSLWTYATFYHSRRHATWPTPWSRSAEQMALFTERDPDRFLAALRRLGIDHMLVPRWPLRREFNGSNYTESFVRCVDALVDSGRLRVLWRSEGLVLVGTPEESAANR